MTKAIPLGGAHNSVAAFNVDTSGTYRVLQLLAPAITDDGTYTPAASVTLYNEEIVRLRDFLTEVIKEADAIAQPKTV